MIFIFYPHLILSFYYPLLISFLILFQFLSYEYDDCSLGFTVEVIEIHIRSLMRCLKSFLYRTGNDSVILHIGNCRLLCAIFPKGEYLRNCILKEFYYLTVSLSQKCMICIQHPHFWANQIFTKLQNLRWAAHLLTSRDNSRTLNFIVLRPVVREIVRL